MLQVCYRVTNHAIERGVAYWEKKMHYSINFNHLERKVMKFKKLWLYILTPLLVLLGSAALTNTVQAKELQNVITNVQVWDVDNGKLKEPDANGVYDLTINKAYSNYNIWSILI